MRDLILITDKDYTINQIDDSLTNLNCYEKVKNKKIITVYFQNEENKYDDFLQIELDQELMRVYDPEILKKFYTILKSKTLNFFIVNFKDINTLKIFIRKIANRNDVIIDNDFGIVMVGNEFVNLINSRPNWDWAYED